jgi:hypothetical protein
MTMNKKIFTPFTRKEAGQLANRLQFSETYQVGYAEEKKRQGQYRGFKNVHGANDYVSAPEREGPGYRPTTYLKELASEDDQLYINGHCNRGLDYLSSDVGCGANNPKVSIDDLIDQLKAHGFPSTSRGAIKLWVCHGALGQGSAASFAEQFSKAMYDAGYEQCRIFAYTESLLAQYQTGGDQDPDPGFHKRVNKPEAEVLDAEIARLKLQPAGDRKKKLWESLLRIAGGDEQQAKRNILASAVTRENFLPAAKANVGGRAKRFRKEFRNGKVIDP